MLYERCFFRDCQKRNVEYPEKRKRMGERKKKDK